MSLHATAVDASGFSVTPLTSVAGAHRAVRKPLSSALMKLSAAIVLLGGFVVLLATVTEAQQQPARAGVLPRHGPTNVVATLRDEAVWEAVMRELIPIYYQASRFTVGSTNGAGLSRVTNQVFYIAVADGDPSDRLLAKLKAIEPKQTLKKRSEMSFPRPDPWVGKQDMILKASRIRWKSETSGVLWAGYKMGGGAESSTEFVANGGGDEWMVMPTGNMMSR